MDGLAAACMQDLYAKVNNVPDLSGKVIVTSSLDDLIDKLSKVAPPAAGVIYEGMRSIGDQGATSKLGLATELVCSVVLFHRPGKLYNADTITPSVTLLDSMRDGIKQQRSPTGHFWRFVVEAAAVERHGVLIYVQRWATPAILT